MQSTNISACDANSAGYAYKIPSNVGSLQGMYEGHAYLDVLKRNASATRAISLKYIYDSSSIFTVNYGINIGFGSIGITNNSDKLKVMAGNYYF